MGEVWAAQRRGQLGFRRIVALKLLRGKPEPQAVLMFMDEARAASALQHWAIVPTFDLGQADGQLYMAMELVHGPSLSALIQRLAVKSAALRPLEIAYLGECIASGLDYANDRAALDGKKLHLVHRDISPHNILLDPAGHPKLTDFGVARTAIQDHQSLLGEIRGKASYMAPEQFTHGIADTRGDIFGLGVVLHECATMKRLFGRSKFHESADAVLKHEPERLADVVAGFPSELAEIIHRCLAKKPEDRYQSAGEVSLAFGAFVRAHGGSGLAAASIAAAIRAHFPPDAFDVRARIKDAARAPDEVRSESSGGETDPTLTVGTGSTTNRWEACAAVGGENPLDPESIAVVAANLSRPENTFSARPPIGVGELWTSAKHSLHVYLERRGTGVVIAVAVLAAGLATLLGALLASWFTGG